VRNFLILVLMHYKLAWAFSYRPVVLLTMGFTQS
jgi:hypothetical protein